MKEKDIQSMLAKKHTLHGAFELKLCKTKTIRFDSVKEHQVNALLEVSSTGHYHKISDFPMFKGSKTRFNRKKPFDFFFISNTPAYVIICFYVPRRRKTCYYIRIIDWIKKETDSSKKSITESEIKAITYIKLEL